MAAPMRLRSKSPSGTRTRPRPSPTSAPGWPPAKSSSASATPYTRPRISVARPPPDPLLVQVVDYVLDPGRASGAAALETARLCLMDTLGWGFLALRYPACTRLLGPVVPGAALPGRGARVPGTAHELEPVH